jgi:hypothetical protein
VLPTRVSPFAHQRLGICKPVTASPVRGPAMLTDPRPGAADRKKRGPPQEIAGGHDPHGGGEMGDRVHQGCSSDWVGSLEVHPPLAHGFYGVIAVAMAVGLGLDYAGLKANPSQSGQDTDALAAESSLLVADQIPWTLLPAPMKSAADAMATNAMRRVYSIRSCPPSSLRKDCRSNMFRCYGGLAGSKRSLWLSSVPVHVRYRK